MGWERKMFGAANSLPSRSLSWMFLFSSSPTYTLVYSFICDRRLDKMVPSHTTFSQKSLLGSQWTWSSTSGRFFWCSTLLCRIKDLANSAQGRDNLKCWSFYELKFSNFKIAICLYSSDEFQFFSKGKQIETQWRQNHRSVVGASLSTTPIVRLVGLKKPRLSLRPYRVLQ